MKAIIIRTNGGKGIGYGHFFRCYSLAKAFKKAYKDLKITFIINRELEKQFINLEFEYLINESFEEDISTVEELRPELFILDTYLADDDYLREIRVLSKLMIFDDNNDIYDSTIPDILLNGNIHVNDLNYKKNDNSLYLLGVRYLVMREEYWDKSNFKHENKEGILVTTGGTDPYEISYNILINIKELPFKKRVIIGPSYNEELMKRLESIRDKNIELIYRPRSIKKYIEESKVAITSGGSTVYEILASHTMPIVYSMADNQDRVCEFFYNSGIQYLGKYPKIKYNNINSEIEKLIEDKKLLNLEQGRFVEVDGQGAKRIVEATSIFLRQCLLE